MAYILLVVVEQGKFMKLTNKQLKKIIAEELHNLLKESDRGSGYIVKAGNKTYALPMSIPEGIPAELMSKLAQLADADPTHAIELAASVTDGGQIDEISDYFYELAIAGLAKDGSIEVVEEMLEDTIYFYEKDDNGEMIFHSDVPITMSKEKLYKYAKRVKAAAGRPTRLTKF